MVWSALSGGAHRGWLLAVALLLLAVALTAALFGALARGRIVWRRTPLDAPFLAIAALLLLQFLVGHRSLTAWALAPTSAAPALETFPSAPLLVGTVAPAQTLSSVVLFLAYVAVYYLVVHHVYERADVRRFLGALMIAGGVVAFGGVMAHLSGTSWFFPWREQGITRRASASFANPDHFAAWLAMLICVGGGFAMAGRRPSGTPSRLAALWASPESREATLRRGLPLIAIGVMALALLLTLSRGAIVATVVGAFVLGMLLRTTGRVRLPLRTMAAVFAIALGYAAWIGLGPLLQHVGTSASGLATRLAQYRSSLSMLGDFPLLGVGLGAYKDIYPRYQPVAHIDAYLPYAHSDVLQFAIETGVVGFALLAWAGARVIRDFVGAHLLGRAACPVGAGAGDEARRKNATSTALAAGGLAALAALLVHSAVEFPLRIPANGFLAAAILGIVTVAIHTRFRAHNQVMLSPRQRDELLSTVRRVPIPRGRPRVVAGIVAVTAVAVIGVYATHAAIVDHRLASFRTTPTRATAEAILSVDGTNPRALAARGVARLDDALATAWRPETSARAGVARERGRGLSRGPARAAGRCAPA